MTITFQDFQKSCVAYLDFKLLSKVVKERYTSLNVPKLYHYIVLDPKFYNRSIFDGFYNALIRFSFDVGHLLSSLLAVAYYLLIIVVKSLFLIFPHAVSVFKAVVKFHREKLSYTDIAVEVVFFTLVLLYLYFRKRLQRAWRQFQTNLARKSEKAAKILPHLLFMVSAGLLAYFGSKFLLPLASKRVLPLFTVGIPLLKTFQLLRKESSPSPLNEKECTEAVVLWIVISIYFCLGAACESIPFSSLLLSYGLYVREFTLVTAVWVQASPACANLVFETVHPLILYYTDKIPAAGLGSSATLDSVFMGLKFFGIPERVIKGLKGLVEDSVAVVVCVTFLFMPTRLANIGVIIIALLLPAFKSSNCIFIARDQAAASAQFANSLAASSLAITTSTGAPKKYSSMTPHMWLEYWACLGVLWLFRFYDFRLWASAMMVLSLWLQNANFRGSSMVLSRVINFVNTLLCYKRKDAVVDVGELVDGDAVDCGAVAVGKGAEIDTAVVTSKSTPRKGDKTKSASGVGSSPVTRRSRKAEVSDDDDDDEGVKQLMQEEEDEAVEEEVDGGKKRK